MVSVLNRLVGISWFRAEVPSAIKVTRLRDCISSAGGISDIASTLQKRSELISEAINFATKAHGKQKRKGSDTPYMIHPLRVALTLTELTNDDEIIAAGILHDTLEDTDAKEYGIKSAFGERVLTLVKGASEPNHFDDDWEDRKWHTIKFLKTAPLDIVQITFVDKLDNLISIRDDLLEIGEDTWGKFHRGRRKQKWYYENLKEVFIKRVSDGLDRNDVREYEEVFDEVFPSH